MVAADIVQRSEIKILLTKRSTVRLQKDRYASDNITLTGKFNIYYSDNTYKLKYSFRVTACQFQVTVTVLDSVLQVAFGLWSLPIITLCHLSLFCFWSECVFCFNYRTHQITQFFSPVILFLLEEYRGRFHFQMMFLLFLFPFFFSSTLLHYTSFIKWFPTFLLIIFVSSTKPKIHFAWPRSPPLTTSACIDHKVNVEFSWPRSYSLKLSIGFFFIIR